MGKGEPDDQKIVILARVGPGAEGDANATGTEPVAWTPQSRDKPSEVAVRRTEGPFPGLGLWPGRATKGGGSGW
jgi:hypothetical protein